MDIYLIVAVICAFIIKGMSGFANTLVFNTLMSFTANNINITPVELLVGFPSNLYIALRERKSISLKVCLPLILCVMIGIVPGVLLLMKGDTAFLKVLFGCIVILFGIELLLRERQKKSQKSSKLALLVIGILSGILCGLFGVGAFLVAYITRTTDNQTQLRSNICFVFLFENTFRILLYSVLGIINIVVIKQALMLLPFMAIGLSIGLFLLKITSERIVKKTVILLLMLSGASLIWNNIS